MMDWSSFGYGMVCGLVAAVLGHFVLNRIVISRITYDKLDNTDRFQ